MNHIYGVLTKGLKYNFSMATSQKWLKYAIIIMPAKMEPKCTIYKVNIQRGPNYASYSVFLPKWPEYVCFIMPAEKEPKF